MKAKDKYEMLLDDLQNTFTEKFLIESRELLVDEIGARREERMLHRIELLAEIIRYIRSKRKLFGKYQ